MPLGEGAQVPRVDPQESDAIASGSLRKLNLDSLDSGVRIVLQVHIHSPDDRPPLSIQGGGHLHPGREENPGTLSPKRKLPRQ